jgi:hypothetical protein
MDNKGKSLPRSKAPAWLRAVPAAGCVWEVSDCAACGLERDGIAIVRPVVITVLRETRNIFVPGIGMVRTRVVEERHTTNGDLVELSKNFFAICDKTNDVFYFGEEVDIFNEDGTITHEGAWLAGVDDALPGLIMPGTFLLGSRYFQEVAPGVALDRAEHVEMGLRVRTAVDTYEDCVKVLETTPLEPGEESVKIYCPGVGLVQDDELRLVDVNFH